MSTTPPTIFHDAAHGRFECQVDGVLCRADDRIEGDAMVMTHTGVPPALRGRGIAAALVDTALAHAAERGLRVVPRCSYVAAHLQRLGSGAVR